MRKIIGKCLKEKWMYLCVMVYLCINQANVVLGATTTKITASEVSTKIENATKFGQGIVLSVAAVALLVFVGYPAMTGGEEGSTKAKKNTKNIFIGVGVAELAILLANTVGGFF